MADEVTTGAVSGKTTTGPGSAGLAGSVGSTGGTSESRPNPSAGFAALLSDPSLGARRFQAPPGLALYEADAPARHLFFIHQGQVRIFQVGPRQSAQLVEILGPGDWFGVPALARPAQSANPAQSAQSAPSAQSAQSAQPAGAAPESRYGMRAVAVTAAEVSEVPAERLLAALPHEPAVARELIAQLAAKLQAAYGHAANLVFDDTEKRLIKALLQFSKTAAGTPAEVPAGSAGSAGSQGAGDVGGSGGVVLRITHQQLAQAVGAARETVSLTLTQLRQRNLLRTGRNRLSFDPRVLEEFARRSESGQPAEESGPATTEAGGAT